MSFLYLYNFEVTTWMQTLEVAIIADDGFYATRRDEALVECLNRGAITDVSVLMNGGVVRKSSGTPESSTLLNFYQCHSTVPGLHLNLSEGEPISPRVSICSLLNPQRGLFYEKAEMRTNLRSIDLHHVEIEIESQLLKFRNIFGVPPLRVDGHQHCHVLPGVVEVICRLLPRHEVKWIRLPEEAILIHPNSKLLLNKMILTSMPDNVFVIKGDDLGIFPRKFAILFIFMENTPVGFYGEVTRQATSARSRFEASGLKCTDAFVGMLTMGQNMTVENLKTSFSSIDRPATVELMTHPGYPLTNPDGSAQGCSSLIGPDPFSQSSDRQHEMDFLLSAQFQEFLKKHNIEFRSFSTSGL